MSNSQDWPDPPVGTKVRKAHHPDVAPTYGHIVAAFDHGGERRYVIAEWFPINQRWFYSVEIGYAFKCGLWTAED